MSETAEGAPAVVAVDIASSGVRALAFDERYRVLAQAARAVSTSVDASGRSAQAWEEVISAVLSVVAEVVAGRARSIEAVVLSGTASSLALSRPGAHGEVEVGEVVLWSDTRAAAFADAGVRATAAARFPHTLCPPHTSYWPAKLRWLQERGLAAGVRFAGAKDLVFETLTGRLWVDPMTAAATGVFDSAAWRWDDESLDRASIRRDRLPEVRAATDAAPLLPALARRLGLAAGTPVVLGGMDGPLAQLGAAGRRLGAHTCTVGTSIAYRAGTPSRVVDPSARVWCYPVEPCFWVVGGAGSNGGNVLTWLAEVLGMEVGDLVAPALALPSDEALVFLPYFHGERAPLWRDDLRGAVVGLGAHHGALDLVRAGLDGVACAALELAEAVTEVVGPAEEVRLTGGFLRDPAWTQLATDALGVATTVPDPDAATAAGAATLAWTALGRPLAHAEAPARARAQRAPDGAAHAVLARKALLARGLREAIASASAAMARAR